MKSYYPKTSFLTSDQHHYHRSATPDVISRQYNQLKNQNQYLPKQQTYSYIPDCVQKSNSNVQPYISYSKPVPISQYTQQLQQNDPGHRRSSTPSPVISSYYKSLQEKVQSPPACYGNSYAQQHQQQQKNQLSQQQKSSYDISSYLEKEKRKLTESTYLEQQESSTNTTQSSLNTIKDKEEETLLPPIQSGRQYTLVLDLDETLIHTFDMIGERVNFYTRPFCQEFLQQMSRYYEVVVFTAAMQDYADAIIDSIDPKKYITHRLYRQHMRYYKGNLVKDLSVLGRNLNKTIIIDNLAENYEAQPLNGYQIPDFYGAKKDKELNDICVVLNKIVANQIDDIKQIIPKAKQIIQDTKQTQAKNILQKLSSVPTSPTKKNRLTDTIYHQSYTSENDVDQQKNYSGQNSPTIQQNLDKKSNLRFSQLLPQTPTKNISPLKQTGIYSYQSLSEIDSDLDSPIKLAFSSNNLRNNINNNNAQEIRGNKAINLRSTYLNTENNSASSSNNINQKFKYKYYTPIKQQVQEKNSNSDRFYNSQALDRKQFTQSRLIDSTFTMNDFSYYKKH